MTLPSSQNPGQAGLHVRYEKAGLIFDSVPIPWNASAVIVEANVRLPAKAPRAKQDFTLAWSADEARFPAELLVKESATSPLRIFFRVRVPSETRVAKIYCREHLLGQVEVPIIGMAAIVDGFALEMPTVYVALADHAIACRSFVSAHAKGVFASALVRSPCLLAPAGDWALRVQVTRADGASIATAHVSLTDEQMRMRQTLAAVALPKFRAVGTYDVSWHLAARCLSTQRIRTVSKKTFLRSLRVSATRFQVETTDGTFHTVRSLPVRDGQLMLDTVASIQPIFYVSSSVPGSAGLAPFSLRAMVGDVVTTLAINDDILVTDGLKAVMLGTLPMSELSRVKHFTLATGATVLGNLALLPAPTADFTAEGGFAPLDDFLWSAAADEQLKDRLGKLLGEE